MTSNLTQHKQKLELQKKYVALKPEVEKFFKTLGMKLSKYPLKEKIKNNL